MTSADIDQNCRELNEAGDDAEIRLVVLSASLQGSLSILFLSLYFSEIVS